MLFPTTLGTVAGVQAGAYHQPMLNRVRLLAAATLALTTLLVVSGALRPTHAAEPAFVWWEGEDTEQTNFPARSWFGADTFPEKRNEVLSGGDWLSASGNRGTSELFARYQVRVPDAGTYALWTRKFWKHGPFRWRFGTQAWRTCGPDVALADSTPIRTHLVANWVHLGRVTLKRGTHTFELRLLAKEGEAATACFDAFLLTPGVFTPRGRLKPGETSGRTEAGWWPVSTRSIRSSVRAAATN